MFSVLLHLMIVCLYLEFIVNSAQRVFFFSSLNIEFTFVHYTLSTTVVLAPCQKSKLHPVRQIFFCGAMAPTLLLVRPGPHLTDVGLL